MKKPNYVLIYEQLKSIILEGVYKEHQKLPSKRKLAENFDVSPLTVDIAYQQLIAEGYVYAIEKKGYYVEKNVLFPLQKLIDTHQTTPVKKEKKEKDLFETNVVDTSLFPNTTWAKLSREVISENHHEMLNVTEPQGLYELRVEIKRFLELYRGMHVPAERIIIGSGTTSLIGMLVEMLGRSLCYGIEKPGYSRIEQLFLGNGVHLRHISIDHQGISVQELFNHHIDVCHVTPSHQFPTGIVMPISRRIELLNWASTQDTYIIEDDYDSEFRFQGKPIPALHGLDQHDRVIYMNTFSKSLAPSFRVSYMVLPAHLMSKYAILSTYHSCTVPTFDQYVFYKFMYHGFFERHINRMRHHYRQKLDIIRDVCEHDPSITLHGDEAGLHFVMEVKHMTTTELKQRLNKHNLHILMLNEEDVKHIFKYPCLVIGYSGIKLDAIKPSFEKLLTIIGGHDHA